MIRRQARLIVVDCETTGFGKHDRVVEIAAITLDPDTFQVIDEYDTLVNPQRDTGPTGIHGVTASMVEAAPLFREIATALARRLDGAILVAHNLAFDQRMLAQEYGRLGSTFSPGQGICTLRATSEKLNVACEAYGIPLTTHHRAIADARATASLLEQIRDDVEPGSPVTIEHIEEAFSPRTLRREHAGDSIQSVKSRIVSLAYYPYSSESLLQYLEMLDWALDDSVVTSDERSQLDELANELGISKEQQQRAHEHYVSAIIAAANRDSIVTKNEEHIIRQVASALYVTEVAIPVPTQLPIADGVSPGKRICFTGTAVINEQTVDRAILEEATVLAGFQTVSNVTKKGCDLLVAADTSSASVKANKARRYGIPVMSLQDFLAITIPDDLVAATNDKANSRPWYDDWTRFGLPEPRQRFAPFACLVGFYISLTAGVSNGLGILLLWVGLAFWIPGSEIRSWGWGLIVALLLGVIGHLIN